MNTEQKLCCHKKLDCQLCRWVDGMSEVQYNSLEEYQKRLIEENIERMKNTDYSPKSWIARQEKAKEVFYREIAKKQRKIQ